MKAIRTRAAISTALVLGAAVATGVKAYTTYSKWPTLNVSFYVNPANADVSQSAAISALQSGMNVWNSQSGTSFRFGYAGQTSATSTGYDGKNLILFRNQSNGSTIASTYVWSSSNGQLVDSDIVFWDGGFKFFTGSSGCSGGAYIEDIAAHELGHALGLNHSNVSDATMWPSYASCSTSFRTLSSDDIAGAKYLYGSGTTKDTPPDVEILSPANGASAKEGVAVAFSGSAMDSPDGDISSKLVWKSSIEGKIGTGASFSRSLKAGTHTISATATDSIGYTIAVAIIVNVASGGTTNTAPSVTISTPANGATVPAGTTVTFSGSASDAEDGNLTSKLVWRSSLEGQIGTGGAFSRAMKAGTHAITATVTDNGGLTSQRSITLNVASSDGGTSPAATPSLSARGYKEKGLQKADLNWSGLTATSVDVYRSNAKIATTANDGAMTDPINKKGNGSYSYKVCAAGTSTCTNQANVSF